MAADTLKILREINNYGQEYIAEEILGISQNTYSRLERNPDNITASQAKKLAKLYNVRIDDLLSDIKPTLEFKDSTNVASHPIDGQVQLLREEVIYLRKQNLEFLKLLSEKISGN